jgi:C1A family cysteine protease
MDFSAYDAAPFYPVFGWRRSPPDPRDHVMRARAPVSLARHSSLQRECSPVDDQGALNSCVGNTFAAPLELFERRAGRKTNASRLFLYYYARMEDGTPPDQDIGATMRSGAKAAAKYGAPRELNWPYVPARYAKQPSAKATLLASGMRAAEYVSVPGLTALREQVARGFPVAIGIFVFESFLSPEVASTGVVPMPGPREHCYGGHAVLVVGYDDDAKRVLVRNSWGPKWGAKGYFTLPYAFVASEDYAGDFWTLIP